MISVKCTYCDGEGDLSGTACSKCEGRGTIYLPVYPQSSDPVNHPSHYTSHPSGIECIEVTRHLNFNVGNAMKYLWRAGIKDEQTKIQDLEKAIWYIKDEIKRLKQ